MRSMRTTMKLNVWRARLEVVGLVALAGTAAFFVATSWRKWPDPLIDFGEQLYSAWQLSQGAVLYRDVDLLYGPLSQYFNAVIFRIFGPGLTVFAFSQFVDAGNYEYAAPYSHEVIHGTLICLLLCLALVHWVDNPTRSRSFLVGLLFGLTVILKPEFIVAGVLMICVAGVARWRLRSVPQARVLFAGAAGAILPTTLL